MHFFEQKFRKFTKISQTLGLDIRPSPWFEKGDPNSTPLIRGREVDPLHARWCGKNPGYIANRHDQSVFSIIRKIHGSILVREETFFEGTNGVYGGFGQTESLKYPFWATRIKNTSR